MPDPVLWPLDDHTRAKHRVLRAYLNAWIPIMAQQAQKVRSMMVGEPRLLLVDGFAGPGRYEGGEIGSPLIMLEALTAHRAFERLGDVEFIYLFIEHDERRVAHLEQELEALELPDNISIGVESGEFEDLFGTVVEDIQTRGRKLVPTFAFVDPFGYSAASMSLSGQILDFPQCEALIFLPLTHVARFVSRAGQENAMTTLFGSDRWREAIELQGVDRREFLLDLFMEELRGQGKVEYVRSFELRTKDGNDYRLIFASGHEAGLEAMKSAMWRVDPEEGVRYIAQTDTGQSVLFGSGEIDTAPLLEELRGQFGPDWFTFEEAERVTHESPFLVKAHLKSLTLKPAEVEDELEVDREEGARRGSFNKVRRMRFLP